MSRERGIRLFWRRLRNGARPGFDADPEGDLIYVDSEALVPSERRVGYGWPPSCLPMPRALRVGYDPQKRNRALLDRLAADHLHIRRPI